MGRHLNPWYGQVILVSGYLVLTAVNWPHYGCAISSCGSRTSWKCDISQWFHRTRTGGRKVPWLPKFLGWVNNQIFLVMGLHTSALGASQQNAFICYQTLQTKFSLPASRLHFCEFGKERLLARSRIRRQKILWILYFILNNIYLGVPSPVRLVWMGPWWKRKNSTQDK